MTGLNRPLETSELPPGSMGDKGGRVDYFCRSTPGRHSIMTATTWVYSFGDGRADGDASLKNLLGGKGANLAEMSALGLPVPPGFTITTEVCTWFYDHAREYPADLKAQVDRALATIGHAVGAGFGDASNPLLVSVRSGARASMPGMMDTILNLGLNDATVEGMAAKSGDARFAYDSYRRFITMYANVVLDTDHGVFEDALEQHKNLNGYSLDTDLDAADWKKLIVDYKRIVLEQTGNPFPQDTAEQLWGAISAVFGSWQNDRAITYRRMYEIPDNWGTAVNVQAMVFGNRGETSATGVAFTRNPSTGEHAIYGEFLVNAQGEDVVAGIRTPQPLTEQARREALVDDPSLEALMPATFKELTAIFAKLEGRYRDMQDIEFTIQEGKLWMLQTRAGKRTTKAALKIAVDLAAEGVISRQEAVLRIEPTALDQLLHPTIDPQAHKAVLTTGLPASPGAASGEIVFDSAEAKAAKSAGRACILVRVETSPEDIEGMDAAAGILTARGGMTSHAAVVARGMGRCCVCGAGALRIDVKAGTVRILGKTLKRGDIITIDGGTGEVLEGQVKMRPPELSGDFSTVMGWADQVRKLGVRANADTPRDAETARNFGAEGIGLCRTEHMFFEKDRILAVREMILADDEAGRRRALAKILPMQRADFTRLFEIMAGLPVTIRLLDPPLHEFLPHEDKEAVEVAVSLGVPLEKLKGRDRGAAGGQPDARLSRLPPRHPLPGNHRNAGARHLRGSRRRRQVDRQTGRAGSHDPAGRLPARVRHSGRRHPGGGPCRRNRDRRAAQLPDRHHGRAAALRAEGRRNRGRRDRRRILLVRHQRSHANLPRPLTRRRCTDPRQLSRCQDHRGRSVRLDRPGRRRRTRPDRHRAWPPRQTRAQDRHLRRTRRRSSLRRVLPSDRPRLCLVFAVPRAGRASRSRPSRNPRHARRERGLIAARRLPPDRSGGTPARTRPFFGPKNAKRPDRAVRALACAAVTWRGRPVVRRDPS